jgi:glutamate-1-semialdehyde 2,1-aminomutase
LDGKKYIDMSIMGIGTNILGYGNDEIDNAVIETVKKGNMSTLSCPEEVMLAERLIEINPRAAMVRFARSGQDKVAICGYHGWHDWYLAPKWCS